MFVYTIHDIIFVIVLVAVFGPLFLLILIDTIQKRLTRKKK